MTTEAKRPEKEPTVKNADVPSQTAGLPGIGEEASGAHFLRDTVEPEADKRDSGGKDETPRPIARPGGVQED